MKRLILLLALASAAFGQTARPTPFVPDSALALLRELSVDIGPRPMGSPAERRALDWAADRMRTAGLDDVRIMPIRSTPPDQRGRVRNTNSGVTVGTLRGSSDRMIIIGAHIDSASPEIPGTNDDGSGTAIVLELARVMARREWQHTMVFCLFGGEEEGLVGSRVFVDQYEPIDRVDLMLQVDMANGSADLIPFIDKGTTQTPSWLFLAAQEELLAMGYDGFSYPFHFFTWNIASGSGASSDHEPFLLRRIPAIDFTTDPSDPIHTPQDSWEWFRPGGLERSGDLVYRLVERFDGGMPEERTGSYIALPFASTFLLVPTWAAWALIILSIGAGIGITARRWSARTERRGALRPRMPGLKVFGALAIIWTAIWSAENLVSMLSGWRSPWFGEPLIVIVPAVAVAFAALVLVALWCRHWDLSRDPLRYMVRSNVWFMLLIAGAALLSPRLAAYLAWGLAFNVVAWTLRPAWGKVAAMLVGAFPAVRLLTPDLFPFIARTFAQIPAHGFLAESALTGAFALVCTIVALPYAFGALAVVRDPELRWPISFSYRRPMVVWSAVAGAVLTIGAASLSEPYSAARPRTVRLITTIDEARDSAATAVESSEWLRDLRLVLADGDTLIPGPVARFAMPEVSARAEDWLRFDAGTWPPADTGHGAASLVRMAFGQLPIRTVVTATTRRSDMLDADAGPYIVNRTDRTADVVFDPPSSPELLLPLTVRLSAPDTVSLTVEATYAAPSVNIVVEGSPVNLERRTIVRATRRIIIVPPSSLRP